MMHKKRDQELVPTFTRVPEVRGKQAGTDHAGGRERFFVSVGAFDIAHTSCTPHTRQLHT